MARKNENSVAALRESPKNSPPMMVAPEREVPGISAKACASPSLRASMACSWSTVPMRMRCWRRSAQDEQSAEDESQCHRQWLKQGRLDGLVEQQPQHRQRHEGYGEVDNKRRASRSRRSPMTTRPIFKRYSQATARMAPSCMTISNTLPFSSLNWSRSPTRIRWPVLDTVETR